MRRLDSLGGVRRELARLYHLSRTEQIGIDRSRNLVTILNSITNVLKESDIEDRLRALEDAQ
jgi:hypothetical protein